MPERAKKKLAARASAKGLRGDRWRRYVYGTAQKIDKRRRSKRRKRKR